MAPQNVFFDRTTSSTVSQRGAILFQNRQTKARKLCIGITFCEAIQAGCWLERTAGYATQRGVTSGTE
eukprot:Em0003g749a